MSGLLQAMMKKGASLLTGQSQEESDQDSLSQESAIAEESSPSSVVGNTDFRDFPLRDLPPGVEGVILSFLSPREIAMNVTFVSKWFLEAVHYDWKGLESGYEERFRTSALPIFYVTREQQLWDEQEQSEGKPVEDKLPEKEADESATAKPVEDLKAIVYKDRNTAEAHAFLLSHGCTVSKSAFSRQPPASDSLSVTVGPTVASCIDVVHGNILVGSDDGNILELDVNSEEEAKQQRRQLLRRLPPGQQAMLTSMLNTFGQQMEDQMFDFIGQMMGHPPPTGDTIDLCVRGGGRLPDLIPSRVIIVDDVVVVAGRQVGPVPDTPHRGQFYAFDAVPRQDSDGLRSDFARGQYMIHNTNLHAASVSALAGWRDPYREEVRNMEDPPPDPTLPKAQYPYGRILTGAMDGTVGVWALCCGDRLAVWQAHDDIIWDVEALPNSDMITCSNNGEIKVWALMENKPTKEGQKNDKSQKPAGEEGHSQPSNADDDSSKSAVGTGALNEAGRAVPTVPMFVIEQQQKQKQKQKQDQDQDRQTKVPPAQSSAEEQSMEESPTGPGDASASAEAAEAVADPSTGHRAADAENENQIAEEDLPHPGNTELPLPHEFCKVVNYKPKPGKAGPVVLVGLPPLVVSDEPPLPLAEGNQAASKSAESESTGSAQAAASAQNKESAAIDKPKDPVKEEPAQVSAQEAEESAAAEPAAPQESQDPPQKPKYFGAPPGTPGGHHQFDTVHLLTELKGHRGAVRCLHRQGGVLFSGGDDGVFVWDLATGEIINRLLAPPVGVCGASSNSGQDPSAVDPGVVHAMAVVGGLLFVALQPRDLGQATSRSSGATSSWQQEAVSRVAAATTAADLAIAAAEEAQAQGTAEEAQAAARRADEAAQAETDAIMAYEQFTVEHRRAVDADARMSTVEVWDWERHRRMYTLYEGQWRPTGLALHLPSAVEKQQALVMASFFDENMSGKAKVWKYEVDSPILKVHE